MIRSVSCAAAPQSIDAVGLGWLRFLLRGALVWSSFPSVLSKSVVLFDSPFELRDAHHGVFQVVASAVLTFTAHV